MHSIPGAFPLPRMCFNPSGSSAFDTEVGIVWENPNPAANDPRKWVSRPESIATKGGDDRVKYCIPDPAANVPADISLDAAPCSTAASHSMGCSAEFSADNCHWATALKHVWLVTVAGTALLVATLPALGLVTDAFPWATTLQRVTRSRHGYLLIGGHATLRSTEDLGDYFFLVPSCPSGQSTCRSLSGVPSPARIPSSSASET